jgi:hypothetical protein
VFRTTTTILILWLENICSSRTRNQKVKCEEILSDITENTQSGYRQALNMPHIFERILVKHAKVCQAKSKQTHSLSHLEELQQCEVCACTFPFRFLPTVSRKDKG